MIKNPARLARRIKARVLRSSPVLNIRLNLLGNRWSASITSCERLIRDLLAAGRLKDLERISNRFIEIYPEQPLGHFGLAMAAHEREDYQVASKFWTRGNNIASHSSSPIDQQLSWLLNRGFGFFLPRLCLYLAKSDSFPRIQTSLLNLRAEYPKDGDIIHAQIELARFEEVPREELKLIEELLQLDPWNTALQLRKGALLRELGRLDESDALFFDMPKNSAVDAELAENARTSRDYSLARQRWKTISDRYPSNVQYQMAYMESLLDEVDFDAAQEHYNLCLKRISSPHLLAFQSDIYRAQARWQEVVEVMDRLCEKQPANGLYKRKRANLYLSMYRKFQDSFMLDSCLKTARSLLEKNPENFGNRIFLVQALVLSNRFAEAMTEIDKLPEIRSERVMRLRAWRAQQDTGVLASRFIWDEIRRTHYLPQLEFPKNETLERIDRNTLSIGRDDIVVFTVVRNEKWRLEWFFSYYRSLGVDYFLFVDNDSDDGTREYLLEQKDTLVFWTPGSYAKAYSGMRWINHLVEEYGKDAWCMYVDVDEAFVFPNMERSSLRKLTTYMKENGHEALFSYMVDMFADETSQTGDTVTGVDFVKQYPYFDNEFVKLPSLWCPWYFVAGGVRRKLGYRENQTKTPIIRGGKGIRFLMSSHCITPAVLSDVTGVLLHFKLAGDYRKLFAEDSASNTRMPFCKQRHEAYARILQNSSTPVTLFDKNTVRFESSQQLQQLGLIGAPERFLTAL